MSTRSRIGILESDGKIESVYCHSDGYLSWNGRLLLENYTDINKIRELISLGDMSSLAEEIGSKHGFDYDQRPEKQCTFYDRDRGETDVAAIKHNNIKEFYEYLSDSDQEYYYLWDVVNSKWMWGKVNWIKETLASDMLELTPQEVEKD
jgi:hypothetical protein